jgi:hypothetical protein
MARPDPDQRPARNQSESPDLEGLPETAQDFPPGKDIDTAEEARMMPRDHSIASGSDPAYPVTASEQRRPETPSDRKAREEPDFGERPAPSTGLQEGEFGDSPEESAMHEERP